MNNPTPLNGSAAQLRARGNAPPAAPQAVARSYQSPRKPDRLWAVSCSGLCGDHRRRVMRPGQRGGLEVFAAREISIREILIGKIAVREIFVGKVLVRKIPVRKIALLCALGGRFSRSLLPMHWCGHRPIEHGGEKT